MLGPGAQLEGKLTVEGDMVVRGRVEGELRASGDIAVEQGADVRALLEGRSVSVSGQVAGNVSGGSLALRDGSSLSGDVRVRKLVVEDGAVLNGHVTMAKDLPEGPPALEPEAESQPSG